MTELKIVYGPAPSDVEQLTAAEDGDEVFAISLVDK